MTTILITSIGLSGFYIFELMKTKLEDEITQKHLLKMLIHKQEFASLLDEYAKTSTVFANDFSVSEFLQNYNNANNSAVINDTKDELISNMIYTIQLHQNIFQFRIIGSDGYEKLRINSSSGGQSIVPTDQLQYKGDSDYFINTMKLDAGNVYFSPVDLNKEHGKIEIPYKSTLRVSTPILDKEDTIQGIAILNVDFDGMLEPLTDFQLGKVVVINQDGDFLFSDDTEKEFSNILGTGHNYFKEQPEVAENLKHQDQMIYFDERDDEFRIWTKIFYSEDHSKYYVFVNKITKQELFGIVADTYNWLIVGIILSLISSIVFTYIIANKISKPLKKMILVIQRLAKNDLTQKMNIKQNDEIGTLANSFDYMIDSLRQIKSMSEEYQDEITTQNKKLEDALSEIKKADKLKEEFSTMVSHELKTPLTPIKGYCEMLMDPQVFGETTQEQKDAIREIERNAIRLETLIVDMLDVQKLDMDRMIINREPFDITKFLAEIKTDLSAMFVDKQINLVINSEINGSITSDKNRLRQVIDNLIKNSVDFVPPKTGIIEIQVKREKDNILFSIKDNGIGIPQEVHDKLFRKFYQVDTSHTRKHGGTGLGLVVCKGIVELLGGKIWFESKIGEGTTFYFSIPAT